MKRKITSFLLTLCMLFAFSNTLAFAKTSSGDEKISSSIVQPMGPVWHESVNRISAIPIYYSVLSGQDGLSLGSIKHIVTYTWTDTYYCDSYGTRELVSSTTPVITSADYQISSLGDVTPISAVIGSGGSSYKTTIKVAVTDRFTGITYTRTQTDTTYASNLPK